MTFFDSKVTIWGVILKDKKRAATAFCQSENSRFEEILKGKKKSGHPSQATALVRKNKK